MASTSGPASGRKRDLLWVLGLMRVLRPGVNLELHAQAPAEPAFGKHPLHRPFDHTRRPLLEHPARGHLFEAAGIAGMPPVELLLRLAAGQTHLLRVDHHHKITGVGERRVGRAMLPHQHPRHDRREPTQCLPLGVHQDPLAVRLGLFTDVGAHPPSLHEKGPRSCSASRSLWQGPPSTVKSYLLWGIHPPGRGGPITAAAPSAVRAPPSGRAGGLAPGGTPPTPPPPSTPPWP